MEAAQDAAAGYTIPEDQRYLVGSIAAALQAERNHWIERQEIERANLMEAIDDAAKNAFEMGEHAERLRALDLVKAWGRGLNGSEYLSRSIGLLFEQIKGGMSAPESWQDIKTVPTDERLILIGSYNAKGEWCSEVWSTIYLRDQFAKSADGFFMNAPHLEWLPTHWTPLAVPPALAEAAA
jgi:hypothetical protein